MTQFHVEKAVKRGAKLRLALMGPSGAGKTMTALILASGLEAPVAVIDTERGSASLYADLFEFSTLELPNFSPQTYMEAIGFLEGQGFGTIIIDSLSHAWMGTGGALAMVDNYAKRSSSGNTFGAWRDVTPLHNAMVDSIVGSRCHIIATMRTKTEYVLQPGQNGKLSPQKVGMAPIQRDGMEYEFTVVGTLDMDNNLVIEKSRCPHLAGRVIAKPTVAVAEELMAWLSGPAPIPAPDIGIPIRDYQYPAAAEMDDKYLSDTRKMLKEYCPDHPQWAKIDAEYQKRRAARQTAEPPATAPPEVTEDAVEPDLDLATPINEAVRTAQAQRDGFKETLDRGETPPPPEARPRTERKVATDRWRAVCRAMNLDLTQTDETRAVRYGAMAKFLGKPDVQTMEGFTTEEIERATAAIEAGTLKWEAPEVQA